MRRTIWPRIILTVMILTASAALALAADEFAQDRSAKPPAAAVPTTPPAPAVPATTLPPPTQLPMGTPAGTDSVPVLSNPSACSSPNHPDDIIVGPVHGSVESPAKLGPAPTDPIDKPLPINLATALRLADARPLVIAAAQAGVVVASGQLERAAYLWLPTANLGAGYIRHDGGDQSTITGNLTTVSRNYFIGGGGLNVEFATTDAIFAPLASRQVLRARQIDVQTAKNDALFAVAQAYFSVQQARGRYAAMLDSVTKARELVKKVDSLGKGLAAPIEGDRARALLADLEQAAAIAQRDWRYSSATLTRILRFDPSTVIAPLEPDHLQVTLISPAEPLDNLIPVGLSNRPELASQQAIVQATLTRLRQERMRPLIPSILLTGNGTPEFLFNGGIFGTGPNDNMNQWMGRSDVSAQVVWQLENLGFGNVGRIRERDGERQLAIVQLFSIQDQVAAEVTQANADVLAARIRVDKAETGLKEALTSYTGNLTGMSQTIRFGDVLSLVNRPQEVVAALQQLQQAYDNYYLSIADYNRAQFRLFHAMGFPSEILSCMRSAGEIVPVDTTRPPLMPPVHAPEPCSGCGYRIP